MLYAKIHNKYHNNPQFKHFIELFTFTMIQNKFRISTFNEISLHGLAMFLLSAQMCNLQSTLKSRKCSLLVHPEGLFIFCNNFCHSIDQRGIHHMGSRSNRSHQLCHLCCGHSYWLWKDIFLIRCLKQLGKRYANNNKAANNLLIE